MINAIISASALAALASAATVDVNVGPGLSYTPNTITAAVGDNIVFHLNQTTHDVAQAAFANPCQPLANGFYSGFPSQANAGTTFSITVNDTSPVYFYCSEPHHCQGGMVGGINVPTTGDTLDAFSTAAKGTSSSTSPPQPGLGGILATSGNATASSSSGAASSAGPSATKSASGSATAASATPSHAASGAAGVSSFAGKQLAGLVLGSLGFAWFL